MILVVCLLPLQKPQLNTSAGDASHSAEGTGASRGYRAASAILANLPEKEARILKAATLVGILLVVLGIIGFVAGGFSFTHEKKDVSMGPVQIQHKQTKTIPISPILSTVALIGGIGLVVVGAKS